MVTFKTFIRSLGTIPKEVRINWRDLRKFLTILFPKCWHFKFYYILSVQKRFSWRNEIEKIMLSLRRVLVCCAYPGRLMHRLQWGSLHSLQRNLVPRTHMERRPGRWPAHKRPFQARRYIGNQKCRVEFMDKMNDRNRIGS